MQTLIILAVIVFASIGIKSEDGISLQSEFFEGIITYRHSELDYAGRASQTAIDLEEVFFSKHRMLNSVIKGDLLELVGSHAILFDCVQMKRYKVDYQRMTLNDIGIEPELEVIVPLAFEKQEDEPVLEYMCSVYMIKYVHSYKLASTFGSENQSDTLITRFYIGKEFNSPCLKEFAALQGNRNTKLLDGRFEGIPLKIVIKRTNGSLTTIQAINVQKKNVEEYLSFK